MADNKEKADVLNNFFTTTGKKMSSMYTLTNLHQLPDLNQDNQVQLCSDVKIDRVDLSKKFKKLGHPSKVSGIDNIKAKDLHSIVEPVIDALLPVLQKSIDSLEIPLIWKKPKVFCLH